MKKLLIVHSVPHPLDKGKTIAHLIAENIGHFMLTRGLLNDFRVKVDTTNFRETCPQKIIPRGYDVYILHPRDIDLKDLEELRRTQQGSWLYCANRGRYMKSVSDKERRLYDDFILGFTEEDLEGMLEQIKNPRSQT